ncbi:helix-turn-helix domain-containing protein [Salicibibacter kimchii]|uniref:helix-turn-helix domain-containing protein n=1 Tax=Salicibibacter kimchii TaxID=2099786 RepID=UPI001D04D978|nr:helix-turn-helix domain-containing protein [Salicibibacter kimchii]
MLAYDWPGNVRELENILGRAVIHMNYLDQELMNKHLPLLSNANQTYNQPLPEQAKQIGSLAERMAVYERQELKAALAEHEGNKTATARALGISVRNLYYKLEKYGMVGKT